jgi:hypothetical protein
LQTTPQQEATFASFFFFANHFFVLRFIRHTFLAAV